ncbi:MAG: LacI family DNA-binding transcriptional regulator [Elusimicrobiota bacterium]
MSVTLKQVADKARVSISTVSRVINNIPTINARTREKVLKVVSELNYSPNRIAKSLVEGRSYTLEMLLPTFSENSSPEAEYFYRLITGILSATQAKSYNLLIKPRLLVDDPSKNWFDFPADGYIIALPVIEDFVLGHLKALRKPAVLVNSRLPEFNWIDIDNVSAGAKVTEHLVKLGHKRIIFIGGMTGNQNTVDRLNGYKQTLSRSGLVFDPKLVFYAGFDKMDAYNIITEQLNLKTGFTAVFAANDLMAYGAADAVKEKGMKVPEDVAVAGFDDISTSEYFDPPLTTFRQPLVEEGKKAAELLIQQIEKNTTSTQGIEMAGELIIRKSCGNK